MAPSLVSYESTNVLDVSQDVYSPGDANNSAASIEVESIVDDRIKTSVPESLKADAGGPVGTPIAPQTDEEDELYAVSPKGKASLEAARSSAKWASDNQEHIHSLPRHTSQFHVESAPDSRADRASATQTFRNPIDDLLENKATIKRPKKVEPGRARNKRASATNPPSDEMQANGDGLSGPIGAIAKSSIQTPEAVIPSEAQAEIGNPRQAQTSKPAINPRQTLGSRPPAKGSSLAALHAKRQLQGTVAVQNEQHAADSVSNDASRKPEIARRALIAHNKPLATPARDIATSLQTDQQPKTGKLPSRKGGMFARTPILPLIAPKTAAVKCGEKRGSDSRDQDKVPVACRGNRGKDQLPNKPGSLKRPVRGPKSSKPTRKRQSTFDVPGSPNEGARASSKRDAKHQSSAKRAKARPDLEEARNRETTKYKAAAKLEGSRPPTRKAAADSLERIKAHAQEYDEGLKSDNIKNWSARDRTRVSNNGQEAGPRSSGAPETLEQFERSIVHVDNDAGLDFEHDGLDKRPSTMTSSIEVPRALLSTQSKITHNIDNPKAAPVCDSSRHPDTNSRRPGGASQAEPILLSDREAPSLPLPPSPTVAEANRVADSDMEVQKTCTIEQPKTPALFRSSPPTERPRPRELQLAGLVDDAARRMTIISFDRSGPRNQGSTPARKRALGAFSIDQTSLPPSKLPLASKVSSSKAGADTLRRSGYPSSAATSMKSYRSRPVVEDSTVAEDVTDALAGFARVPKHRQYTTAKAPTVPGSLAREPGPISKVGYQRQDDEDFAQIDDYEGLAFNADAVSPSKVVFEDTMPVEATASQLVMPPPAPKRPKAQQVSLAQIVPPVVSVAHKEAERDIAKGIIGRLKRERAEGVPSAGETQAKRTKLSQQADSKTQPTQVLLRMNKLAQPKAVLQHLSQKPAPDAVKRPSRKPSRQASQGSQRVDMHGSPIPAGMDVPERSTALEAFSLQAGISSGDAVEEETTVLRRTATQRAEHPLNIREPFEARPSHQPKTLSSNRKPLPVPPAGESQATNLVVGTMVNRKLVISDEAAAPPTDPFTSSVNGRQASGQQSTSSNFLDQLQRVTAEARKRNMTAFPPAPSAHKPSDDPDKTLVEPDPYYHRIAKRAVTVSTNSSSELSDSTEADLMAWRTALKPHQMNLFDELLNVSHKLIRHLVDRETAMQDIVQDYQRRGQKLVEQMELSHAKEYQQYVDALGERKRRAQKELEDCKKKLQECTDAAAAAAKPQNDRQAGRHTVSEEEVMELMASFC